MSMCRASRGRPRGFGDVATLFRESASRVVVSVAPERVRPSCWRWRGREQVPARATSASIGGDRDSQICDRWRPNRHWTSRWRTAERDLVDGDRATTSSRQRADCAERRTTVTGVRGLHVDKFKDECGVFGIFGHPEAANLTYLGLYALQHRGQESAGIAASDGAHHPPSQGDGLRERGVQQRDAGEAARLASPIGHVRYSTAGESRVANAQPILIDSVHGQLAICHNGNLVNAGELRDALVRSGAIFQTTSDTEVIVHLFARSREDGVEAAIVDAMSQVRGAFSFVMMTKDRLIAARDPHGFRPLALGRLGDAWVVCSETCALDLIGATYVRDVEPGEVVIVERARAASRSSRSRPRRCRSASSSTCTSRGPTATSSARASTRCGRSSAGGWRAKRRVDADVVVPIPDSGVCAAIGYAEASGIPMRMGLIRNHYVGRTFIEPQQSIRHFGVRVKLNPVRSILEGKRVVLVDDSIVRGTTSRKIVRMVRSAGAREVHMRISCPPTISPCFYGVDTPRRSELIAATHTLEEIRKYLDADSVGVSEPRRPAPARCNGGAVELLHVVLHRRLSRGVPARRGGVSAAGAEAESREPRHGRARAELPIADFDHKIPSSADGLQAVRASTSTRATKPSAASKALARSHVHAAACCRTSARSAGCSGSSRGDYREPVLVVERRWRRHQAEGRVPRRRATTRSAPISSTTASTTSWSRAREPLFFLDYLATGRLSPAVAESDRRRAWPRPAATTAARCSAARPRRCPASTPTASTTSPASSSASSTGRG